MVATVSRLVVASAGSAAAVGEGGDDRVDLPPQQRQQVVADPGGALGMALAQEGVAGRPEVFDGVDDVEDQGMLGQGGAHLVLEGVRPVGQRDPVDDLGPIPPLGPGRQPRERDGLAIEGRAQLLVDRGGGAGPARAGRPRAAAPPPPPPASAGTAGWCRAR